MNNALEGIKNSLTEAEEWISDLEWWKITVTGHNIEKIMKKKKKRVKLKRPLGQH